MREKEYNTHDQKWYNEYFSSFAASLMSKQDPTIDTRKQTP